MRCIDPQLKSYTERGHPVRGWLGICISALVCMLVGLAACDRSQDATQSSLPQFSIRWIDETADGRSRRGPPDADRVVNSTTGRGDAGAAWLRREGALDGPIITETHVGTGADGGAVVQFTFTPEAAQRFAEMTRNNLGHRLAFVLNGKIIMRALINGEMTGGQFQLSGYYTDSEAHTLAAELMAANQPQ